MARYLQVIDSANRESYINIDQSSMSAKQEEFRIKAFRAVGPVFTIEFLHNPAVVLAASFAPASTFTVSGSVGGLNDGVFTIVSNVGPIYTVTEAVVNEAHSKPVYPIAISVDGVWRVAIEGAGSPGATNVMRLLLNSAEWASIGTLMQGALSDTVIRAGAYVGWS